uniref:Thrombomodulin n=1 Tax=Scleropages formosus TaxID=113540 RepID=A0A8C9RHE7_SCLFO
MKELLLLLVALVAAAAVARVPHNCSCAGSSCYSVVLLQTAADARASRRSCEQQGGRLLRDMSAESRDALRVLLDGATVSGDLWTGLQLPNRNCAEPLLKPSRRRFQWMDEELSGADFPAATGTESQACAPLCVSLSRDFTLTERPCHDQISGYICAHAQSPASACDPLALPLGSGEVALFNLSAEGGEGRCSAVFMGGCQHKCSTHDMRPYTCSCRDGFAPNPKDRRECVQHCPSYECPAICDPNNPEQCRCPLGYIYDVKATQGVCVDINECEMDACDQSCDNTFGSFSCSCYKGYYMDDGGMCRLVDGGLTTPTYSDSSTPTVKQTPGDASLMTPGAMVGIIVCILLIIVVLMFLVHRKRWTMNGRGAHNVSALPG